MWCVVRLLQKKHSVYLSCIRRLSSILAVSLFAFSHKGSATAEVQGLKPSQEYRLKCVMIPYENPRQHKTSPSLPFQTEEAFFRIRNIRRWRRSVTYYIDSNINAMTVCYILTKRRRTEYGQLVVAEILDSFKTSTSFHQRITLTVPNSVDPLLTKCEMYDSNNNCCHACVLLFSAFIDQDRRRRSHDKQMENHRQFCSCWYFRRDCLLFVEVLFVKAVL